MAEVESATARGSRILKVLKQIGSDLGLHPIAEYPVVGGRIDLVWIWKGSSAFPSELPIVGFEIESSWRTRKHIKGDFLNLMDLQPALGIIVLLGEGEEVESTRKFARAMVDRHPGRFEIWSEQDVVQLSASNAEDVVELFAESGSGAEKDEQPRQVGRHVGKYRAMTTWLGTQSHGSLDVSFVDVEEILGFPLPPSARRHPAYWSGGQPGSTIGNAIRDAGWRAHNLNMTSERVTLERDAM